MRHLLCMMLIWATLSATSASGLSQSTGVATGFVIVSRGGVQALAGKAEYTGPRAAIGGSPVAKAAAVALAVLVGGPMTGGMGGAMLSAIGLVGNSAVSTVFEAAAANEGHVAALFGAVKADYFLIDTNTRCVYGMVGGAVGGAKGGAVGAWKLAEDTGGLLGGSYVGEILGNVVAAVTGGATGAVTGAAAGCVWGGEYGGNAGGKVGTVLGGVAKAAWALDPKNFKDIAEDIAAKCLVDAIDGKFCVDWKAMMDAYEEGGHIGAEAGREWEEWAKETYH